MIDSLFESFSSLTLNNVTSRYKSFDINDLIMFTIFYSIEEGKPYYGLFVYSEHKWYWNIDEVWSLLSPEFKYEVSFHLDVLESMKRPW